MGNRNICKWCREPYSGTPVCPSSWGWMKKEAVSHCSPGSGGLLSKCYCSEKCRAEAEGGNGGGGGESRSAREEEYESGGGSSSSGSGSGGMGVIGNVIGGVVLILLLIIVIGVIFSKSEDANDPAVKMAKWEEHLEKRRAAFAEGLSEEGVEARGLKNFTWEEWQARNQKGQAKASGASSSEKEDERSIRDLWNAHQKKRRDFINAGHTQEEADAAGLKSYTFEDFKQNYKNIKYKTLEEIKQSPAANDSSVVAPERLAAEYKDGAEVQASKDSKGIAITVEGKGKTRGEAVRSAIRYAMLKTVGKWVGSKVRMDENRDAVIAQIETITEDDVRKFEVLDTQQQDGAIVLKVKVHVSKKKIAPKFAPIFPDVFGND